MEKKIGFIGCGNMGKAILGGLIASGQVLRGKSGSIPPPRIKSPLCMISLASTPQNRRRKWHKSPTSFLPLLNLAL